MSNTPRSCSRYVLHNKRQDLLCTWGKMRKFWAESKVSNAALLLQSAQLAGAAGLAGAASRWHRGDKQRQGFLGELLRVVTLPSS